MAGTMTFWMSPDRPAEETVQLCLGCGVVRDHDSGGFAVIRDGVAVRRQHLPGCTGVRWAAVAVPSAFGAGLNYRQWCEAERDRINGNGRACHIAERDDGCIALAR